MPVLNTAHGTGNGGDLSLDKMHGPNLDNESDCDSDGYEKPTVSIQQQRMNSTGEYEKLGDRSEEHYYKSLIKENTLSIQTTNTDGINVQTRENNVIVQDKCEPGDPKCFDVTPAEDSDDGYEPVGIRSDQLQR